MNNSISIIIPNYNGEKLLKKNLPKVIKAVGNSEIIVIDDCSTDGSLNELVSLRGKVKVIKNKKNVGFSTTVNRGVRESSGEIIVLLNTDVVPETGFLTPMISHFGDDNVFAVGCMDKSIEGDKIILRGRGLGEWRRGFLVHSRGDVDKTNTLWVAGGSGAFRKSIWEKLGGFDELYSPFYWEDIDLSYRALKSGYKVYFEPKSVVVHEHAKGSIKNTYSKFKIKTIAYRNQFIFVWKNATDLGLQFSHLFWLPYHFIKATIRGDYIFFTGFFLAFLRLPQIILSGFRVQKYFTKSDQEIIKSLA